MPYCIFSEIFLSVCVKPIFAAISELVKHLWQMLPLLRVLRPNDVRNLFWQKETSEKKIGTRNFIAMQRTRRRSQEGKKQKKDTPNNPPSPLPFFSIFVNPSHTPNFGVASSSSFQRVIFQNQEEGVEGGGCLAVILELNVGEMQCL